MNDMQTAIVAVVIAGVGVHVLTRLVGHLFTTEVTPWFEARQYQGIELYGKWTHSNLPAIRGAEGGPKGQKYEIDLKQRARSLSGEMKIVFHVDEETNTQKYTVTGSILEGYVFLNCKSPDRRVAYQIVMLLKVVPNLLIGHMVGINFIQDSTDSIPIKFARKI